MCSARVEWFGVLFDRGQISKAQMKCQTSVTRAGERFKTLFGPKNARLCDCFLPLSQSPPPTQMPNLQVFTRDFSTMAFKMTNWHTSLFKGESFYLIIIEKFGFESWSPLLSLLTHTNSIFLFSTFLLIINSQLAKQQVQLLPCWTCL